MEPSKSNSRKAIRLPKGLLFASIAGGIYYLLIQFTPLRIPCFFRTVTGLQCPGCGVTHMILALLHLDFPTAFHANPVLFCLLFLWAGAYLAFLLTRAPCLTQKGWLFRTLTYSSIGCLLAFGVIRNLPFAANW